MTFNYNDEDKTPMLLVLENGISVKRASLLTLELRLRHCRQTRNGIKSDIQMMTGANQPH